MHNAVLFPPFSERSGSEPNFGRGKLGNYDELASQQAQNDGKPPLPRFETNALKYEFKSEMLRRGVFTGKVDEGIKAGDLITTAASIAAPIAAGKVLIAPEAPQTLKSAGALPEVDGAAAVTNSAKVANNSTKAIREDSSPFSSQGKVSGRIKSSIDEQGNLRPANPTGKTTVEQHIRGSEPVKSDSPFTSFKTEAGVGKTYGSQKIELNIEKLRGDVSSGKLSNVEIIENKTILNKIQAKISEAEAKYKLSPSPKNLDRLNNLRRDFDNARRDGEILIKGIVPKEYITVK